MIDFKKHYEAIKKRGKITPKTTNLDFAQKVEEEFNEWVQSDYNPQEGMDIICAVANQMINSGYDIKQQFEINLEYQLKRKD